MVCRKQSYVAPSLCRLQPQNHAANTAIVLTSAVPAPSRPRALRQCKHGVSGRVHRAGAHLHAAAAAVATLQRVRVPDPLVTCMWQTAALDLASDECDRRHALVDSRLLSNALIG